MIRRILLIVALFFLNISITHADSPEPQCNQFETIQSIILSEATSQPYEAQLEVARVAVTRGPCLLDSNFYTGYGIATDIAEHNPRGCIANTHCLAYYLLYAIDPTVRESAARASYTALTEVPQVKRFHFDNWQSQSDWWDSREACPSGWFIVAELKVC